MKNAIKKIIYRIQLFLSRHKKWSAEEIMQREG